MKKSILLVEDNAKLASLLQKRLIKEGYSVSIEARGDRAVYRIIREQPDLVMLDIMLPGLDGKQICHTVRRDYRGSILMLTALDDEQSEVSSLNWGADAYLTKPVADEVLKAHVAALFRRPPYINENKLIQFDALEIDLAKKEVSLNGGRVELSPSEFELFSLLVLNHDITLSRDTIMRTLRGREHDGIDRSIDIRISRLRKVFKDDEKMPQRFKTVHGRGYVFVSTAWK